MLTIIFIFLISQYKIVGQTTIKAIESSDSEILVRCFDEIPENKYLDSIGLSFQKKKKFCYLWTCFSQSNESEDNSKLNDAIYSRIKDIAKKLYYENKAIIIVGGCENFIEKEKNIYGKIIQIINIGNCSGCIKFKESEKRIEIFNNEIKNLFGILK
ncbi:MAG: hypothetical protein V4548_01065 [Bacteroidota bacterium]